jgi:hypothetical protein
MTGEPPHFTRVRSEWTAEDRRGAIRCRLGTFRMRWRVEPGLYALGRPDADAPVLVTANYRLGFDMLRRDLGGIACWILVLDTNGINVWCAAGAGTFGTDEVVFRVQKSRLAEVVRHRTLILPQLAAPGVSAESVARLSGFAVRFGPVRSRDIPAYLARGSEAGADMRAVRFGARERAVLVPAEVGQSLMRFPAFAFVAILYSGLGPGGVTLGRAWSGSWPLFSLGLGAVLSGSVLVPLLLPLLPVRAFSAKGWALGAVVTAVLLHGLGLAAGRDPFWVAACWLFFPAASAWMALAFTGATPFTSPSGARAEVRATLPVFAAAAALALAALVLSKLKLWGLL